MRTAHPREQLGNRLICDSLAISYHSRDIDDTIAEEEEPNEEENDDDDDSDGKGSDHATAAATSALADSTDLVVIDETATAKETLAKGGGPDRTGRDRRGGTTQSRNSSRVKSRSVSPGYCGTSRKHDAPAGSSSQTSSQPDRKKSGSSEFTGNTTQHDYVNSAPVVLISDGVESPFDGSSCHDSNNGLGSIPMIPPPPQKQQSLNRQQPQQQQLIDIDSDPYGKEFDAISSDSSRISAATGATVPTATVGNRINGRVGLPSQIQQQPESSKEIIPPRLRNGFVERAVLWSPAESSTGEV